MALQRWLRGRHKVDELLLEPTHEYASNAAVQSSKELLSKLGKTGQEVVTEYLKQLWKYTETEISRKKGDDWKSIFRVRVVLTVPAVWTAGAKDRTIQAPRAAGLPESIEIVTEPEAGALAVLRDKEEMKDLDVRTFKFFSIFGHQLTR